jgi:hypothetical protein
LIFFPPIFFCSERFSFSKLPKSFGGKKINLAKVLDRSF